MSATTLTVVWRLRQATAPLVAVALGAAWFVLPQPDRAGNWILFLAAAVVGELLVLDNLRGGPVPASLAVLGAYALLGNHPAELAAMAAAGWLIAAAIRRARAEEVDVGDLVHRVAAAWSLPGLVSIGSDNLPGTIGASSPVHLGGILLLMLGLVVGPAAWRASSQRHSDFLPVFFGHVYATWASSVAMASSAALAAVVHDVLGVGALVLLALPVVAVRAGLHRYTDIRRTYDQTVVAMSHMTELTGHVSSGHGLRVRDHAVAIARDLGLSEREVEAVERAALLHEVGRIATDDPEQSAQDREVAAAGAVVLRQAGGPMSGVAEAVERVRDPYRRPGAGDDRSLSIVARIVRSVCEYDRYRAGGLESW
ncbi:MAG: HD domain-containing protein, partial [Nitriliruptorales bacterium]